MDGFLNLEHSCSSILHLFCARTPYISSSCIALFYNAADFIVKLLKSHFCGEKSSKKLYVAHIYENPNNLPSKASRYTVQPGRLSGCRHEHTVGWGRAAGNLHRKGGQRFKWCTLIRERWKQEIQKWIKFWSEQRKLARDHALILKKKHFLYKYMLSIYYFKYYLGSIFALMLMLFL